MIIANTLFIINSLVRVTCGGLIANHSRFVTETLLPIYEELVSDLIKNFSDFIIDGISPFPDGILNIGEKFDAIVREKEGCFTIKRA